MHSSINPGPAKPTAQSNLDGLNELASPRRGLAVTSAEELINLLRSKAGDIKQYAGLMPEASTLVNKLLVSHQIQANQLGYLFYQLCEGYCKDTALLYRICDRLYRSSDILDVSGLRFVAMGMGKRRIEYPPLSRAILRRTMNSETPLAPQAVPSLLWGLTQLVSREELAPLWRAQAFRPQIKAIADNPNAMRRLYEVAQVNGFEMPEFLKDFKISEGPSFKDPQRPMSPMEQELQSMLQRLGLSTGPRRLIGTVEANLTLLVADRQIAVLNVHVPKVLETSRTISGTDEMKVRLLATMGYETLLVDTRTWAGSSQTQRQEKLEAELLRLGVRPDDSDCAT